MVDRLLRNVISFPAVGPVSRVTDPRVTVQGQSTMEYAIMLAAVVAAVVVMGGYVREAMNAHGNSVEEQLNGAVRDNRPALIP
jgi:hypothetical protein